MEQDLFMALVRWRGFGEAAHLCGSDPGCLCKGATLIGLLLCLLLPLLLSSLLL